MTDELKTLEDLPTMVRTPHRIEPKWINVGDLRELVIKWVKFYDENMQPAKANALIDFCNIKEEELK